VTWGRHGDPVKRDYWGRPLRCPTPRAYPDPRMPGGVRYEPCRRNTCPSCVLVRVLQLIAAMALVPLRQFGYVTAPEEFSDLRTAGSTLRRRTNAAFRDVEDAIGHPIARAEMAELSESGRPHLHVATRGPVIRPAEFQAACARHALGYADLQRVRQSRATARYMFKTILPGPDEEFIAGELELRDFLDLGAGRLLHTHHDFWVDVDGTVLGDAEEAIKAAAREWRRHEM
jgi:hypothetical protein